MCVTPDPGGRGRKGGRRGVGAGFGPGVSPRSSASQQRLWRRKPGRVEWGPAIVLLRRPWKALGMERTLEWRGCTLAACRQARSLGLGEGAMAT